MRKLVVLAGLALIAAPATAQTTLGLKGGVGFGTVIIEQEGVEEESVSGFVAGMELGVPVSNALSLRFSGTYAHKGGSGNVEGGKITLGFDYVQLSALARVGTSGNGGVSVGVMAGPWAAYRLSCEVGGTLEGLSVVTPCVDPPFADFEIKTLDFGVAFGGGVEFPVAGSVRLGLDALYSLGLASIDEDDSKTRHLTIQSGFVIPIG